MIIIDGFEFDMARAIEHAFANAISDYPVEKGSDTTDHIRAQPIIVTVTDAIKSDFPLLPPKNPSPTSKPSEEALAKLMSLYESKLPVKLQTPRRIYENMALQTLSIPEDASTGAALWFSATFKQLRIVTSERTMVVATPVTSKNRNLGQRTSPKFTEEEFLKKGGWTKTITHNGQPATVSKDYFGEGPGIKGVGRQGRVPKATGGSGI